MRGRLVAIVVAAAFVLSGCQYLLGFPGTVAPIGGSFDPGAFPSLGPGAFPSFDPGVFPSFDPNDPGFSVPPPLATFTKGTATVTIGGAAMTLDQLSAPGTVYADFGTDVGWTDGNGLYLHFYGYSVSDAPSDSFVTIDRIKDGQHWATASPEACTVKVTKSDTKGLTGTATCKGAQWADTMAATTGSEPALVKGEAAFDSEMTFSALP